MLMNPSRLLFMSTLLAGTLISVSSTSWIGAWIGLEINLLSFIPLMTQNTSFSNEAALKYFLVQALASSLLLCTAITMGSLKSWYVLDYTNMYILLASTLLMKMGAAPFHFWFPGVMEGLDWGSNMIIMTWQKMAPLMLLSYLMFSNFILSIILLTTIAGSLGGFNQTSLRKIMAYSSINHLGWMIAALMLSDNYWVIYFSFYTFLSLTTVLIFKSFNANHLNQISSTFSADPMSKLLLFLNLLSLGGLPPFSGFFPKWMVIESMMNKGFYFILFLMVMMTLITLFFYLRITYSALLLTQTELKWMLYTSESSLPMSLTVLIMMSLLSLPLTSGLIWFM